MVLLLLLAYLFHYNKSQESGCRLIVWSKLNGPGWWLQRRDELLLSEHFSEGVRRVRKALPAPPLRVLNFDWHGMIKELREQATVEGLWTLLEGILPQVCSLLHVDLLNPSPLQTCIFSWEHNYLTGDEADRACRRTFRSAAWRSGGTAVRQPRPPAAP